MLPGRTFTPEDIVGILRRRRWLLLLPFALGLAAAPYIAQRIPEVFKSETLIMVVPQRVPDSYVKSTVTGSVEDRLPSISDQILSRSRLERVITDFDLYKEQRRTAPMEDVVARMRADIGPVQMQPGQQSFRVNYVSRDPVVAQKVTARLASLFIDENSRDRENLAESTNVFLESQLEDAKRRLVEHEKMLEGYRRQHAGELPNQLDSNLRAIQTAQMQLQSVSDATNHARERRGLLERQLLDAQTALEAPASRIAAGSAELPTDLSASQQLDAAQRALEALRLRYTSDHPDVRRMERTIKDLKGRVEEESKRPAAVPVERMASAAEQTRQRRIRDLRADLESVDRQIDANQREETRLKAVLDDYQRKVDVLPTRESELVELTRDYETLKKSYDGLLTKREDSQLAANLERRQIGEQFRILDLASLPVRPANERQRLALSFSGAAVGLAIGLLLAAFLEYRSSSFSREDEVVRVLDLAVLAVVPTMASAREERFVRGRNLALNAAAAAVFICALAIFVTWGIREI